MTLPENERTIGAYMIVIGARVEAAESRLMEGDLNGVAELVRVIAELARHAIQTNAEALGVAPIDYPRFVHRTQAVSEYLLDIESSVVRYKAHRPGLRGPDAAPKILNHLLEILSAASACLEQYGWNRG